MGVRFARQQALPAEPQTPRGFPHAAEQTEPGSKGRIRDESFSDQYSQARHFYRSQSKPEQAHIAHVFVFELSKVETVPQWLAICAMCTKTSLPA